MITSVCNLRKSAFNLIKEIIDRRVDILEKGRAIF